MIKWGALAIAAAIAATALASSAGASPQGANPPTVNLSSRAAATAYLRSLGLNPRGFVIQRGARNYAGPNCPGKRWTCTVSTRVLQIAQQAGRTNSASCAPSWHRHGSARRLRDRAGQKRRRQHRHLHSMPAISRRRSQDFDLFQTNSSGTNTVNVDQQVSTTNNTTQDLTQSISVRQGNVSGSNVAHVTHQSANASVISCCSQSQDASQSLSLTQSATRQRRQQRRRRSIPHRDGERLSQRRPVDYSDPEHDGDHAEHEHRHRSDVWLRQELRHPEPERANLSETASGSGQTVTQTQGSPVGGLNAMVSQSSTGVSTYSNTQTEQQTQNAADEPRDHRRDPVRADVGRSNAVEPVRHDQPVAELDSAGDAVEPPE